MDEQDTVELVRVPRQEQVFEREAIFGRDTSSVFPSQAAKDKAEKLDAVKSSLGLDNSRFITETQLEEIKKTKGGSVEDGSVARDKTLAAILAENKAKKEEAFQDVWRSMKQGKNRPLDEDDLQFVNKLVEADLARERGIREAEKSDIETYQEALRKAAEQRQQPAETSMLGPEPAPVPAAERVRPAAAPGRPILKPQIRIKQKAQNEAQPERSKRRGEGPAGMDLPDRGVKKRQKAPEDGGDETEDQGLLAGLMGGYASDSDE